MKIMMKDKIKKIGFLIGLMAVALILIVAIVIKLNPKEENLVQETEIEDVQTPDVESIEVEPSKDTDEGINAMPVTQDKTEDKPSNVVKDTEQEVVIEEPMPTPPKQPELEAPTEKPTTDADLEDMDTLPTYKEEETRVETDEVVRHEPEEDIIESEPVQEESDSQLVPPSENPFLNLEQDVEPIEVDMSDISDYVPGTGDKF
jgi:hypothetical protein